MNATIEIPRQDRILSGAFVLVMLSTFGYFLTVGALMPVLPVYVEGPLGGSSVSVGLVVGAFSLTALLVRPFAGRLGDRRGRPLLIVSGALLAAASVAGYRWATTVAVLVALRLVTGVAEALFFVGAASAVGDLAPGERRGEAMSLFSLALWGGMAAGPLVGESLLHRSGFAVVWLVAAGSSAVAGALAVALRDTRPPGSAPGPVPLVHRAGLRPGFVLFSSIIGLSAFMAFVPLHAIEVGMSGSRGILALYGGILVVVRSAGARLPDRIGIERAVRISLAGSILGLVIMATWTTPAGLVGGVTMFAFGQALGFPSMMAMAVRAAPASERGAVVGTFMAFFDLAIGVGGIALGGVAAALGYAGTFGAAAVVTAVGLAVVLKPRRKDAPTPRPPVA